MIGHTELRTAQIWLQLNSAVPEGQLVLQYSAAGNSKKCSAAKDGNTYAHIYRFLADDLEPGTKYTYTIHYKKQQLAQGEFRTQELWQRRKDPADFSFIAGSCSYFNEPAYDRPGKPYGGDSSIFLSMSRERADFMLWLGDNWYTREADYFSAAGLTRRPSRDRSMAVMQPLLKAMPHYAIWDDHDYGPNDMDKSYVLKEDSRNAFKSFWANPSYGFGDQGIYTKFTWNDVDVFMMDDRWYRDNDRIPDSLNGQLNTQKCMFGKQQLDWLKTALLQSNSNPFISFRIIATGSQVLNTVSPYDCFCRFPAEYNELMAFLEQQKIRGVIFLTGDRHHSSVVKLERANGYTLYDVTASPLTSGTYPFGGPEENSPIRVLGIAQKQNYARISFSGKMKERRMLVEFLGVKGEKLEEWSITADKLKY